MSIEVKFFPEFSHLSSDGESILLYDATASRFLELDPISATIVEEAVVYGDFNDDAMLSARELLNRRGVSEKQFSASLKKIKGLINQGLFQNRTVEIINNQPEGQLHRSMTLNVSSLCQLGCRCCSTSEGDYDPGHATLTTLDLVKSVVDMFLDSTDPNADYYQFTYFGCDTLVNCSVIKDVTQHIIIRCASLKKQSRFTIITNAVDLTEETAMFLHKHKFSILLSLDGNEELLH
ncbi:MAG: hypothetical protein FWE76_00650 [Symbiobacteriaceae bacterium]|nr:hypothetical protein [Symbiobacteriaceae bacterium]